MVVDVLIKEVAHEGVYSEMLNVAIIKKGGSLDNDERLKNWLAGMINKEITLKYIVQVGLTPAFFITLNF